MTKKEEKNLMTVDTNTGEVQTHEVIIQDTETHTIVKQADGKYRKDMKYQKFFSHVPTTKEEQKTLYKVFNSNDNTLVTPMMTVAGKIIKIVKAYTNPYESFSEETGQNERGVTTTIFDGEKYYVTSSKSVYYSLFNLFDAFGYPDTENYEPIEVQITSTKQQRGNQINIELV